MERLVWRSQFGSPVGKASVGNLNFEGFNLKADFGKLSFESCGILHLEDELGSIRGDEGKGIRLGSWGSRPLRSGFSARTEADKEPVRASSASET